MNAPFYLVWCPTGHPPKVKHQTPESADTEARRLAKSNPGQEFYVLAPISVAKLRDPVEVTTFGNRSAAADEEIPF